jgi:hypothetical protein
VGIPLLFEACAAAFDPTLYECPVLPRRFDDLRDLQQRFVGRNEDG